MVTDVYKARRSKYKDVKIWSKIDLGTCRVEDLFITDAYYNPINDFKELKISDFSTSGEIIENFSVKEKRKEEPPEKESPQIKKTLSLDDF